MSDYKKIEIWLYIVCAMVFAMAVVGAVTRLTESGLSMVEWRPLIGWLPPLNDAEWHRVYALYKQSPEFAHKHFWMELTDFQKIFFWEWLHRLLGRLIGLVYALPLAWFALTKKVPRGYGRRLLGLFFLGGAQGLLGWWMVKSGLTEQPEVSHFRLAAHLSLALILFSLLLWTALDIRTGKKERRRDPLFFPTLAALFCLAATIIWGAFTAGLDAGLLYNTWPLMNGQVFPPESLGPLAMLSQPAWVQFTHRWIAFLAGCFILLIAYLGKDKALGTMVVIQIGLGISTLLSQVVIPLAALHQAGAVILLALLLRRLHLICYAPSAAR